MIEFEAGSSFVATVVRIPSPALTCPSDNEDRKRMIGFEAGSERSERP